MIYFRLDIVILLMEKTAIQLLEQALVKPDKRRELVGQMQGLVL
jgi:hypothetical protein